MVGTRDALRVTGMPPTWDALPPQQCVSLGEGRRSHRRQGICLFSKPEFASMGLAEAKPCLGLKNKSVVPASTEVTVKPGQV